jgi:MFS transporter, PAT family, beta-lactamase induction signal transducer AmpG
MSNNNNEKEAVKKKFGKDYIWAFTTYFTEGFPYAIIRSVSAVFFRDMKAPLSFVGLTSLFGIPWILKFLWGPWVDEFSTKRRWMISMQVPLVVMIVLAALFVPFDKSVYLIYGLFFIGAFIAATNDIAIDGYYMEALDKEGQSKFVGYRTMAFRVGWMAGLGLIVTIGAWLGWFFAFIVAAAIFGLFFLYHLFFLPEPQTPKKKMDELFLRIFRVKTLLFLAAPILAAVAIQYFLQSPAYAEVLKKIPLLKKIELAHVVGLLLLLAVLLVWAFRKKLQNLLTKNPDSNYSKAFISFMAQDKIGIILSFIIFLRFGEWMLTNMTPPFIMDLGIKIHYGWLSSAVGLPSSILGAMVGGWMISSYTLKKMAWPFILAQNFTHIFYTLLAMYLASYVQINTGAAKPVSIGVFNLVLVALTMGFEQFAGGLGMAVLMTYLMRICNKDFKAAHYAIGTALMNLTAPFAGVSSGLLAGWLGYAWLFGISFMVAIPGMLLIPFLPYLSENDRRPE